jgi:DNA-binding MarR family transcriptional regulator
MSETARWLTEDEQATWRAYLLSTQLLDEALDRQLLRDAQMPVTYYAILVTLSDAPEHRLRMSDLARRLRYSPSRMTHAMTSLEAKEWVRREKCPSDRRGQLAVLTEGGMRALRAAAPRHVTEVRAHLFDHLSPQQVEQLREICETVVAGFDTSICDGTDPAT